YGRTGGAAFPATFMIWTSGLLVRAGSSGHHERLVASPRAGSPGHLLGGMRFERLELAFGRLDLHALHARMTRAASSPGNHVRDRLRRTLYHGFDGAVAAIAHPAADAVLGRLARHGIAKAHALHVADDHQAARCIGHGE